MTHKKIVRLDERNSKVRKDTSQASYEYKRIMTGKSSQTADLTSRKQRQLFHSRVIVLRRPVEGEIADVIRTHVQ